MAGDFIHGAVAAKSVDPDYKRQRDDFYETPVDAVTDLLAADDVPARVWEPACGRGAISRVIEASGRSVISTDLVDRGFGLGRVDFLLERALLAPAIVTNPPFRLAEDFLRHGLSLEPDYLALFVKLSFLAGIERGSLYRSCPPARVLVFSRRLTTWRPDVPREGRNGGMIDFAWLIWRRGEAGGARLGWL